GALRRSTPEPAVAQPAVVEPSGTERTVAETRVTERPAAVVVPAVPEPAVPVTPAPERVTPVVPATRAPASERPPVTGGVDDHLGPEDADGDPGERVGRTEVGGPVDVVDVAGPNLLVDHVHARGHQPPDGTEEEDQPAPVDEQTE